MKKLVYQYIPTVLEKKSSNIIKILLLIMGLFIYEFGYGQTTLIDPTVEGGFENATSTLAANGWTAVNTTSIAWFVGTPAGAQGGTKAAFVGSSSATYVGSTVA